MGAESNVGAGMESLGLAPTPSVASPSIVNPTQFYSSEPAPMGIGDFGVTGPGPSGTAYAYSTASFQGQAIVRSMSITISGTSSKLMAFELNAMVVFQRGGTNYSYWIQNGLHLDASSHQYSIGGAYVWNFSTTTAKLTAGELQGNSSSVLATDTYYFIPNCAASFTSQCTTLVLPASLLGRIVTSTSGGFPYVAYQYNVGTGWITYDNVSFLHMAGATDAGFHVDGFKPTPIASSELYDAEWVWVGAGGGSAAVDQQSDLDLSLDYWNGHNYQAVPGAWNFGSNTGETSSNVTTALSTGTGLDPSSHLASGPGTLKVLYNASEVGFVNLSVPTNSLVSVLIDGSAVPIVDGWTNLTLMAGSHSVYLQGYSNASGSFEVAPGATTFLDLAGAGEVTIAETGLPAGTSWGVSVNGTVLSTTGTWVTLNLPNGTYPITYLAVPGFQRPGPNPSSISLPGTTAITIGFVPFTYAVTFTETGLPVSTLWWVNASGELVGGTGTSIQLPAPNGSTPFEAGSAYEFVASPASGTIHVTAGIAAPIAIAFGYRPTFIIGFVDPADADVAVDGEVQPVLGGLYNDSVIPGSYEVTASATGFVNQSLTVIATPGNVSWANFTLQSVPANNTTSPPPAESSGGGIPIATAAIVIVAAIVVAALVVVVIARRR